MHRFLQYIALIVIVVSTTLKSISSNPHKLCNFTNNKGPQKNKPCIFPFKIGKTSYLECTNEKDPEGRFWCSTKVDKRGQHVGAQKQWGYCDESCSFGNTNFNASITDSDPRSSHKEDTNALDFSLTQKDLVKNLKDVTTTPTPPSTEMFRPLNPITLETTLGSNAPTIKDENALDFSMTQKDLAQNLMNAQTQELITPTTEKTSSSMPVLVKQQSTSITQVPTTSQRTRKPTPITTTKPIKVLTNDDHKTDYYYNDPDEYYDEFYNYDDKPLGMQEETSDGTWLPTFGKDTCGEETDSGYIVGGTKAKGGEFPFMAALGRLTPENNIFFMCGGTLINRRYILTAAHCHSLKPGPIPGQIKKAVLGAADLSQLNDVQTWGATAKIFDINPNDVIQHEDYDPEHPQGTNLIRLVLYEIRVIAYLNKS